MNRKMVSLLLILMLPALGLVQGSTLALSKASSNSARVLVYKSNFNALTPGLTQPFPGSLGQDGWFSELALPPAYGEIETEIAHGHLALHEFTSSTIQEPIQTIDKRLVNPPDLSRYPLITLQADFYAHTSDLSASNIYDAWIGARGGPHPGFEILGFSVISGNGTPKIMIGVNVGLVYYNGVDNNQPIPLTVGQNLTWDSWHRVIVIADQAGDHYVSLQVDGKTEDLSTYLLPRSDVATGVWERGQLIEEISAVIVPNHLLGSASDDDIYWDNLKIMVERIRSDKN